MIQKAIEKIDDEIKSGGMFERTLGEYVKSELLTSDSNALKILAPNTDLETFMERLWKIASLMNGTLKDKLSVKVDEIKSKKEFDEKLNDLGWRVVSIIKTGAEPKKDKEADGITDENLFVGKSITETYLNNEKENNPGVCMTSELIIPLLRIYYGIPLEASAEKGSAPKRRRFSTVSLD